MTSPFFKRPAIDCPPHLIVGAGPLTAHVWRSESADADQDYLFDLRSSTVLDTSGLFRTSDLLHFCSLLHVLAQELLHDGAMSRPLRTELGKLLRALPAPLDVQDDEFTPSPTFTDL